METKRIAMMAATGSAAFLVGFAAFGLVAMATDTVTQVSAETTRVEPAVNPVKVDSQVTRTHEAEIEIANEQFAPDGNIKIVPEGTYVVNGDSLPRKFRDLNYFAFETSAYSEKRPEDDPWVPIPPKGTIVIGKKIYRFTRIAVGATTIGFQTEERNGVSYKLTGRFNNFDYCETDEALPDVMGRLVKLEKNKWAAEAEVSFSSPGCFCSL